MFKPKHLSYHLALDQPLGVKTNILGESRVDAGLFFLADISISHLLYIMFTVSATWHESMELKASHHPPPDPPPPLGPHHPLNLAGFWPNSNKDIDGAFQSMCSTSAALRAASSPTRRLQPARKWFVNLEMETRKDPSLNPRCLPTNSRHFMISGSVYRDYRAYNSGSLCSIITVKVDSDECLQYKFISIHQWPQPFKTAEKPFHGTDFTAVHVQGDWSITAVQCTEWL